MIEIDVDHGFLALFAVDFLSLEADQERTAGDHSGDIACVPSPGLEKQVFALLEPEQRDRFVLARGRVPAKEDRVFPLHLGELGRKRSDAADVVAELVPVTRNHAQVLVCHIVKQRVSGHGIGNSATFRNYQSCMAPSHAMRPETGPIGIGGRGYPRAPAAPPDMRVRIRRVESVQNDQTRKSERVEARIRQPC